MIAACSEWAASQPCTPAWGCRHAHADGCSHTLFTTLLLLLKWPSSVLLVFGFFFSSSFFLFFIMCIKKKITRNHFFLLLLFILFYGEKKNFMRPDSLVTRVVLLDNYTYNNLQICLKFSRLFSDMLLYSYTIYTTCSFRPSPVPLESIPFDPHHHHYHHHQNRLRGLAFLCLNEGRGVGIFSLQIETNTPLSYIQWATPKACVIVGVSLIVSLIEVSVNNLSFPPCWFPFPWWCVMHGHSFCARMDEGKVCFCQCYLLKLNYLLVELIFLM